MKKIRIITLVGLLVCILNFKATSQTLSSVISETISFLQGTASANTVRNAVIEFSFVDDVTGFGIISGRANLSVESTFQTIGTKSLKKFFLKSVSGQWVSTSGSSNNKTFTFTSPIILIAPSTLSILSGKGTANNNVRYDLPAFKTNNSLSNGANEYIISGFLDPSTPKRYITIRIIQQFIQFG